MSKYNTYVNSYAPIRVCSGSFSNVQQAKTKMQSMVASLLQNIKQRVSTVWDDFKAELPKEITVLLEMFENGEFPPNAPFFDGENDTYYYCVDDTHLSISVLSETAHVPDFEITTNALGFDGSEKDYFFHLKAKCLTGDMVSMNISIKKET